jgi:vancomycin resistance protein VanW
VSARVRLRPARPRHPFLSALRARQRRHARGVRDRLARTRFTDRQAADLLPIVVVRHTSPLRRRLAGTDPRLQETKIENLRLAAAPLDRLVLEPGETVSFWRRVGRPSAARGYREGLVLVGGRPGVGIGGGLCQLSNLLHWMALNSELEVTERHHHSVDAFPDDRRELPFGTGASVAFDLIDFRLRNPTDRAFQLEVRVDDADLVGAIRTTEAPGARFEVVEVGHRFEREGDVVFRCNEVHRRRLDAVTGAVLGEDLLMRNRSRVAYPVDEALLAGHAAPHDQDATA